jgi:hypothetical protein
MRNSMRRHVVLSFAAGGYRQTVIEKQASENSYSKTAIKKQFSMKKAFIELEWASYSLEG